MPDHVRHDRLPRQVPGLLEGLAAALRGENPNREVFVKPTSSVFSPDGLLTDRWGSPLIVHPEAWKQLEIRSAGPDRVAYNADDLIITPAGIQPKQESQGGGTK